MTLQLTNIFAKPVQLSAANQQPGGRHFMDAKEAKNFGTNYYRWIKG